MKNEKLNADMSIIEALLIMSECNPGAITVLKEMMSTPRGSLDILLLDSLDIRGDKIWKLYSDCSDKNIEKYNRTLLALRSGAYTDEEIQGNLDAPTAIPFLDDSIKVENVPSYGEDFGPTNEKWTEYLKENRKVALPKIQENIEKSKKYNKKNNLN